MSVSHDRQASRAGMLLAAAAAIALLLANSPLAGAVDGFWQSSWGPGWGVLALRQDNRAWLNQALMALFFLLVGVELRREWSWGVLARPGARLLPLAVAACGMAIPALIYLLCTQGRAQALPGWAIGSATDIAFALGFLALLAPRMPRQGRALLMAVAVLDDLGAVLIIATCYTQQLAASLLAAAAAVILLMLALQALRVLRAWPYLLCGCLLWLCLRQSGVHPTLAGVLTGLLLPQQDHGGAGLRVARRLQPLVTWLVLPLFALANAGVTLAPATLAGSNASIGLAVAAALLLGKPLGVLGGAALARRIAGAWPDGFGWRLLLPLAGFCGVGFTMSLFIAALAFGADAARFDAARLGVLAGSALALGLAGVLARRYFPAATNG